MIIYEKDPVKTAEFYRYLVLLAISNAAKPISEVNGTYLSSGTKYKNSSKRTVIIYEKDPVKTAEFYRYLVLLAISNAVREVNTEKISC